MARNFFATPEAEQVERSRLAAEAAAIGRGADSVAAAIQREPRAFNRTLARVDSLQRRVSKHAAYLSLRSIVDSRDTAAAKGAAALDRAFDRDLAFLGPAVAAIPEPTFAKWAADDPAVARWQQYVRLARDNLPRVDRARMDSAAATAARLTGRQNATFQRLMRGIDFGTVATPEGALDLRTRAGELMNHTDRAVRERWYRQNRAGLASARDSFAVLLTSIVDGRNTVARQRGFADYREESYRERGLSTAGVRALLERVARAHDLNRRYEKLRVAHLEKVAGLDSVGSWDLVLPEPGATVPRFTIMAASSLVRAAVAPLGTTYGAEMAALLDPANGRMDLLPRPFRAERQGFSTGLVGYPSMFFQGRFSGYLEDVIVLAHEAGHSVQNMLMERRHVLTAYAWGPSYFTESFAGLNELLVADHLWRTGATPADRIYALQRFLDQATEIFKTAREATFEDDLYALENPTQLTAAELESRMQDTGTRFSIWFGPGSHRIMEWQNAVTFYTWPLYRVNYLYSKLLALAYFAELVRDPAGAGARYEAMLSNGYAAPPEEILRRFSGLSLDPDALVARAVTVIAARVAELETLYGKH